MFDSVELARVGREIKEIVKKQTKGHPLGNAFEIAEIPLEQFTGEFGKLVSHLKEISLR